MQENACLPLATFGALLISLASRLRAPNLAWALLACDSTPGLNKDDSKAFVYLCMGCGRCSTIVPGCYGIAAMGVTCRMGPSRTRFRAGKRRDRVPRLCPRPFPNSHAKVIAPVTSAGAREVWEGGVGRIAWVSTVTSNMF